MSETPTLAKVVGLHERGYSAFNQCDYCTCDEWSATSDRRNNGHLTHGEHVQAVWRELCTIETVEQLDALPEQAVVRNIAFGVVFEKTIENDGKEWWDSIHGELRASVSLPALLIWHPEWSA